MSNHLWVSSTISLYKSTAVINGMTLSVYMHQRFNVFLFQIWYHISIVKSTYTSCFSIPALSTQESSAVQIWAAKSLPSGKGFDFLPSRFILYNLVHPEGYIKSLILSGKFSNFTPISWGIFLEQWVKFLGYERLAVILFYIIFMVSYKLYVVCQNIP